MLDAQKIVVFLATGTVGAPPHCHDWIRHDRGQRQREPDRIHGAGESYRGAPGEESRLRGHSHRPGSTVANVGELNRAAKDDDGSSVRALVPVFPVGAASAATRMYPGFVLGVEI